MSWQLAMTKQVLCHISLHFDLAGFGVSRRWEDTDDPNLFRGEFAQKHEWKRTLKKTLTTDVTCDNRMQDIVKDCYDHYAE